MLAAQPQNPYFFVNAAGKVCKLKNDPLYPNPKEKVNYTPSNKVSYVL